MRTSLLFIIGLTACTEPGNDLYGRSDISDAEAWVNDIVPTVVSVAWNTAANGPTWVEYGQTEEFEGGRVDSLSAGETHEVLLLGLEPDQDILWRLGSEVEGEAIYTQPQRITTGMQPIDFPEIHVDDWQPEARSDGYLLSTIIGTERNLIGILNRAGAIVWWYEDAEPDFWSSRARFAPDGSGIFYNRFDQDSNGEGSVIIKVSWTGETEEFSVPRTHHDFIVHPDGTIGAIINSRSSNDDSPLMAGGIVEISPEGEMTEIWSAWNTLVPPPEFDDGNDWTHFNALAYDELDEAYLIGSLTTSAIHKIDRSTGEMLWTMGGEQSDWDLESGSWFRRQHQIQLVEDDGILVFDNRSNTNLGSRVVEYTMDSETMTLDQIGEYGMDNDLKCYVLGDVDRMDNGNTLVTWSPAGFLSEHDEDGNPIWELSLDLGSVFGYLEFVNALGSHASD